MHRSFARRRVLEAGAALGGTALLAPLGGVARAAGSTGQRWPTRFPLPDGFRPEGITIGSSPYAYFGSIANGDVYRASLATGRGRVISQGLGAAHPVIGLKIDRRERLERGGPPPGAPPPPPTPPLSVPQSSDESSSSPASASVSVSVSGSTRGGFGGRVRPLEVSRR